MSVAGMLAVPGAWMLFTCFYAVRVIGHRGEWLHYEGNNLYHAHRLGTGHGLYRDALTDGAWNFPIYPPGLYAMWAPFIRWTGTAMWPGRLISVVSMAVICWAIFQTCRALRCSTTTSLVGALVFVTFPGAGFFAWGVRPDTPALAFMAVGVLVVTRWENDRGAHAPVTAALLMVAMVFTKHNFAPVAVALGVDFLLRDRRAAARYALVGGGVAMALLGVVQVTTGAFVQNMVGFAGGVSLHSLADTAVNTIRPSPHPALILALVAVVVSGWRAVTLTWVAGFAVLLTAVKVGSSVNYAAVIYLTSAILLAVTLEWINTRWGPRSLLLISTAAALLLVVPLQREMEARAIDLDQIDATSRVEAEAVEVIRAHPGRIVGDRDDLILEAGRESELEPYVYAQLEDAGTWDPAGLVAALDAHRVALVQTRFDVSQPIDTYHDTPVWPRSVIDAVRRSYCLTWHTTQPKLLADHGLWLYEPC